jgi:alpha-tubulin suppressor-like RCC1 family protein
MDIGRGRDAPAADYLGLGDGRPIDHFALYPVAVPTGVVAAAAGGGASFAVLTDGRVLACGVTGSGELGITPLPEFETRAQPRVRTGTPTPVAVSVDAVDISCIANHVLALSRDGGVYAWGRGEGGQLGIGPLPTVNFRTRSARVEPYVPYPVRIPDLANVTALATGNRHSIALLKDGTVRAWGFNGLGQVGDGSTTNRDRPVAVSGVRNAVAIAAGWDFSVALLSDGTVMEWGATYTNPSPRPTPATVVGARGIRALVAGGAHVAAITNSGGVMTWGSDGHYETGRSGNPLVPAPVRGLDDVRSLAAADGTTTAVLGSGRIMTWGEVREWTRPGSGGAGLSPFPILLWLDGLDQS